MSVCSIDGCNRRVLCRGWCKKHYHRWYRANRRKDPGHGYTHGLTAYLAEGCRCVVCREAAAPMEWAAEQYLSGTSTMRGLGEELGLSHERVRQMLNMWIGGFEYRHGRRIPRSGAAVAARRAEKQRQDDSAAWDAELEQMAWAHREGVTCRVCGAPHHRRLRGEWSVTCSSGCAGMWGDVRLLADPDYHQAHMRRVARWNLAHRDEVPECNVTHAERLLADDVTHDRGAWAGRSRTRWLQEGSRRWEIACRAYREGWPTFEDWPEDVKQQIREHVDGTEAS